jgi:hypothetical protein
LCPFHSAIGNVDPDVIVDVIFVESFFMDVELCGIGLAADTI